MEQVWATPENDDTDYRGITNTRGTIPTRKGSKGWYAPIRPKGISLDEWEAQEQEKWDRIFSKQEVL